LAIRENDPFFWYPSVDPLFYHQWAMRIAGGDWLGEGVFLQGPLYPYLLGALYGVTGPDLFIPRVLNALAGALAPVLVWWVARRLFDRRVALLAAAMVAVYAMFVFYGGSLLIVNLLLPLTMIVLWSTLGAAERATPGAWLGAGLVLAIAPSTLRNAWVAGDPVLISASGGMNFFNGNNPDATGTHTVPSLFDRSTADHPDEQNAMYRTYAEKQLGRPLTASETSNYWLGQGVDYIRSHPADALRLMVRKFLLFFNANEVWNNRSFELTRQFSWVLGMPLLNFGVVGPLAILGLMVTARRWRELLPLYAMIGVYLGTAMLFFVLSRYRAPVVPILMIFAASALVWIFDAWPRRVGRLALAGVALAVLGLAIRVPIFPPNLSMAYYNLGNKYQSLGRHDEAVTQYRNSLSINGDYISAHNNLALSLEKGSHPRGEALAAWARVKAMGDRRGMARYVERATRHLRDLEEQ
jgi:4-amino-4-deoxy-L-arabinose transferase-like glycosyltransferase